MSTTETQSRPKILCVDDERAILDGLSLHLRRRYEVLTAESGAAGLQILEKEPTIVVVMSDMRMPGMDGAVFLTRARQLCPDTVRLLLTGQADLASAIAAINEGQIFRFLTKPCPPATVLATFEAAVEQNRLITSERVLLEQTLHGSIKALTDILALTHPASFGRGTRIKQLVSDLASRLAIPNRWEVEVAAMLSQLGTMTVPTETLEKQYAGKPLTLDEQRMLARAPAVTEQLVRNIPRLEAVAEILAAQQKAHRAPAALGQDPHKIRIDLMAQLLRAALDFDDLDAQGSTADLSVDTMRGRLDRYEPRILDALAEIRATAGPRVPIREVTLAILCAGMVFVDDVKTTTGTLLVARGFEVTPHFIERARNLKPGTVREPLRVVMRVSTKPGAASA